MTAKVFPSKLKEYRRLYEDWRCITELVLLQYNHVSNVLLLVRFYRQSVTYAVNWLNGNVIKLVSFNTRLFTLASNNLLTLVLIENQIHCVVDRVHDVGATI
jgi:hypothetical protein